ncbi:glycerophosphodiester phosphodiesterase [Symbiobacterium thermophilum]|jgi:glycerophosphoryl diester phosphodiesterase|uniref:Glycerophosphodiester phosphodiesterase n=1 Tax=Symbiobacterium thermophilum TaxID=2734 RepID=A0A953I983_SYMTR|nr:glycerophosphodiester phosphodiesterase [Symbiobacterium thermophilum]MBY6276723.1 glycerophosphodiester phosphodiesterase [Symbiobacterium thermophilum]
MSSALIRRTRRRPRRWPGVLLTLALVLAALAAVRALTIRPLPDRPFTAPRPVVLAHQGASGHAPSNTMEAFRLALEQGADILELDVHMTRDGVVVVSHDETIDRMSDGTGLIKEMTLAELRRYDFGYRFTPDGGLTYPYRGKGVTIPTLEEVLQAFPEVPVNIEIKQAEPPMEAQLWELIQRYGAEDRVLVASFHGTVAKRWRDLAGDRVATSAPVEHMYLVAAHYLSHLDRLYAPAHDAFQVPVAQKAGPLTVRFDTERFLRMAERVNVAVHYWTINDEDEMRRLYQLGAHGIITDYPDRAVKVLRELGLRD